MLFRNRIIMDEQTLDALIAGVPEIDPADPVIGRDPVRVRFFKTWRHLAPGVMRMAVQFNAELDERTRLQQDCGSFVLAYATGDPQYGVQRGDGGIGLPTFDFLTDLIAIDEQSEGPATEPGQIVLTLRSDGKGDYVPGGHHFMVRASVDDVTPSLYASKLGPSGLVVVHRFVDAAKYYQSDVMGVVAFSAGGAISAPVMA